MERLMDNQIQKQTEVDDRDTFEIVADKLFAAGIGVGEGWEERVYTCSVEGCKGNDSKPFASTTMHWLEREGRYVFKTVQFGQPGKDGRRRTMFAVGINVAEPLTSDRKPNLACAFHAREALKAAIKANSGRPSADPYVSFGLVLRELENIERAGGLKEREAERKQRELVNSLVSSKIEGTAVCVHCGREIPLSEAFCPERWTLEKLIDELTQQLGAGEQDEMLARRAKLLAAFYDKHFGSASATLVAICNRPRQPMSEGGRPLVPCLNTFLRMVTGNPERDRVRIGDSLARVVVPAREILKRQTRSSLRRAEEGHKEKTAIEEWEESVGLGVTVAESNSHLKAQRSAGRQDERRGGKRGNRRDRTGNGWKKDFLDGGNETETA
jgi:hypothetical protein